MLLHDHHDHEDLTTLLIWSYYAGATIDIFYMSVARAWPSVMVVLESLLYISTL